MLEVGGVALGLRGDADDLATDIDQRIDWSTLASVLSVLQVIIDCRTIGSLPPTTTPPSVGSPMVTGRVSRR